MNRSTWRPKNSAGARQANLWKGHREACSQVGSSCCQCSLQSQFRHCHCWFLLHLLWMLLFQLSLVHCCLLMKLCTAVLLFLLLFLWWWWRLVLLLLVTAILVQSSAHSIWRPLDRRAGVRGRIRLRTAWLLTTATRFVALFFLHNVSDRWILWSTWLPPFSILFLLFSFYWFGQLACFWGRFHCSYWLSSHASWQIQPIRPVSDNVLDWCKCNELAMQERNFTNAYRRRGLGCPSVRPLGHRLA